MHEKCIAAAKRGLAAFMEREKVYANLADISRMLEVASKLGRLATGMATDRTEVTGEDGGPIRIELEAALKKVYGQAGDLAVGHQANVVDVEATPAPHPGPLPQGEGMPALPEKV
jgi:thymidine phosphorylase